MRFFDTLITHSAAVWVKYDQAVVRGCFTLIAVVAGAYIATNQWRSRQRELRKIRQQDTRDAIYAEIRDQCETLVVFNRNAPSILRIRNIENLPFLLEQPETTFFDPGKIDISLLNSEEINWLVQYSQKIHRYNLSIKSLDSLHGRNFPIKTIKQFIANCYGELVYAEEKGREAMKVLEVELGVAPQSRFDAIYPP